MQALQTGLWSKSGQLATRARNSWRCQLKNRHRRKHPMSDQGGKVLNFGPFELSLRGDEAQSLRAGYCLRAPLHAQLGKNALEVRLHGLRTNIKAPSDFLVGQSFRDQLENASLARTQCAQNPCTRGRRQTILSCSLQTCHEPIDIGNRIRLDVATLLGRLEKLGND